MTTPPSHPSPAGPHVAGPPAAQPPPGKRPAEPRPAVARPPAFDQPEPTPQPPVSGRQAVASPKATPPPPQGDADKNPYRRPRWETAALLIAGAWSACLLILGVGWLAEWPALDRDWLRNPFDPAVDVDGELTSLLTQAGARGSALTMTVLAAVGVVLVVALAAVPPRASRRPSTASWPGTALTAVAAVQAFVLAVLLPDYRVIATVGYTPVLLARQLFEADGPYSLGDAYTPVTVAMIAMTLAGLAFAVAAVGFRRRWTSACPRCGRTDRPSPWTAPAAAARRGRWATVVAIVIPVGYATTRWAWALGIPLGVRQSLLDQLGSGVWMGAFLGSLAIGGAVLTAGLVRPWGEVFPRWIPGLRGRRVPIAAAVVPALFVAVITASAGLMFLRIAVTGQIPSTFGGTTDVAAWLPEMFWPLWGAALAAAAVAYWLRRRGPCADCGRGVSLPRR